MKQLYTAHSSATEDGHAGVTILVARKYTQANLVQQHDVPQACTGYVVHVTIQLQAHNKLHVLAVYMPVTTQHIPDRGAVYEHLSDVIGAIPSADSLLLTGDWNAVLLPQDRQVGTTYSLDMQHAAWVTAHPLLQSVYNVTQRRAPTYTVAGLGDSPSMIDDTLLLAGPLDITELVADAAIHQHHGYSTDHAVLVTDLNTRVLASPKLDSNIGRRYRLGRPEKRLETPIRQADQDAFQLAMSETYANEIMLLEQKVRPLVETEAQPFLQLQQQQDSAMVHKLETLGGGTARATIDELANELMSLLNNAHQLALTVCPVKVSNPSGTHYRPKAVGKRRRKLMNTLKAARALRTKARAGLAEEPEINDFIRQARADLQACMQAQGQHQQSSSTQAKTPPASNRHQPTHSSQEYQDHACDLKVVAQQTNAAINALDKEHARLDKQTVTDRVNTLLQAQPKRGHKMIFGSTEPRHELNTVTDPVTGRTTSDTAQVQGVIERHFRELVRAPTGCKHGKYLPEHAPRNYPWQAGDKGAIETFQLQTDATAPGRRRWLAEYATDEAVFFECLKSLSSGKAPGPDKIGNELLKMLPVRVKKVIHMLFILMWTTGITPDAWKHSETCLIYKKGDPTQVGNYRPIGLANTVYKLWTRVVTYALSEYAEENRILSGVQCGFRRYKGTHQQLQMLVMAIEDAKLSQQDLYALQVDFSSAFNMTDHDITLQVMYDLGYPTDAIEVVKDIYTHATTAYKTPHGPTAKLTVDRGTLQGDTLSPFLFILYIEPLLRWLHVGGRGYKLGTIQGDQDKLQHACSSLAYADDLEILTQSLSDMRVQADKLTRYADWSHMKVNTGKTIVSGILHATAKTKRYGVHNATDARVLAMQLDGKIIVQGKPVVYQHPSEPFTYLGVDMTFTLNWGHQLRKVLDKLASKGAALRRSSAAAQYKMRIIQTVIKPMITYAFSVAPYKAMDLKRLDSKIAQMVKAAYRQCRGTPTAMIMEDTDRFGLGTTSLLVDYAHACIKHVTYATNDEGTYGVITRNLMHAQAGASGGLHASELQQTANSMLRIRQLSMLQDSDLKLWNHAEQMDLSLIPAPILTLASALHRQQLTMQGVPASLAYRFQNVALPLMAAGINELKEIINANGTHVLSAMDMKRRYGPSIQAKQVYALHRIAYMLHTEEPVINNVTATDLSIKAVEARRVRLIHPAHRHLINPDAANGGGRPRPRAHMHNRTSHVQSTAGHVPEQHDVPARVSECNATNANPSQDNSHDATAAGGATTAPQRPPATVQLPAKRSRQRRHRRVTAADLGMRSALENEAADNAAVQGIAASSAAGTYTTRQQRAARWYQAGIEYASTTQAERNARKALAVAGCNADTWQARQIISWRQLTTGNATGLQAQKRRHAKGTLYKNTQKQYLVEWQPNVMEPWEIQLWQQLGYKVQEATPVTHTAVSTDPQYATYYDQLSCEACNKPDAEDSLLQCDTCHRLYHTHCIQLLTPPSEDEGWNCTHCNNPGDAPQLRRSKRRKASCEGHPAPHTHMPQELVIVRWAPSWEPEDSVEGTDALTDWQELQQHQGDNAANVQHRPDELLTDMQRQGIYGSNSYISHLQPQVRHQLQLEHQPINPYTDIIPTGTHKIEIRTILERHNQKNLQYTAACCYGPDGRSVGQVSPARLQMLRQRFDDTLAQCPNVAASLQPASFEQEVYRLLLRYKQGSSIAGTRRRVDMKNHWTTPPELMQILQRHLGITKERFASPLNVSRHTKHYWSCHARDQLFGAHHDAYSCKWNGISESNPEYEHSDMCKAIAWAVQSAQATPEPVLTLCILPAWDESSDTAYNRWLRQAKHNCHVLLRIPRACFKFMTPDAWKGAEPYAGHPKWDINFILVGNTAGFSTLTDMNEQALCRDIASFLCSATADNRYHARLCNQPSLTLKYKSPRPSSNCHLWTEPAATPQLPAVRCFADAPPEATQPAAWHTTTVEVDVQAMYNKQSPLLVDPDQLIFTDGSVLTAQREQPDDDAASPTPRHADGVNKLPATRQVVGAGLFIPNKTPRELGTADGAADTIPPADEHATGTLLYIDPTGEGPTNTITRAESAAILHALHYGTCIATDSAACMYQLRNMMMKPMRMRCHKNRHMLQSILDRVQSADGTIRIFKVKAHTGVLGNEYADEAAKKATKLLANEKTAHLPVACHVSAAPPYTDMYWPVNSLLSQLEDTGNDGHLGPVWLDDLTGALKRHLHPIHKLGHSNTDSMYYKLWRDTVPLADCRISNAYLNDTSLAPMARRLTFQARCGQTNTANQRYKCRQAPNNRCLLCDEPDGVFHSLGGCSHMKGMYIQRHNEAVWIIMRSLLKGRLGASLVMHDAGHKHDAAVLQELWSDELADQSDQESDIGGSHDDGGSQQPSTPLLGTRIPDWIYSTPLGAEQDKAAWNKYRPDILIAMEGACSHGDRIQQFHNRTIHIVEVKYCRDTDRSAQCLRAEQQHEALRAALLQVGYKPEQLHLHVITLGATGTIYREIHATLKSLGIDNKLAAHRCCADLHKHAVAYVMRLLKTKWAQEHAKQKRGVG
jgi:ribonuclease HI